MHMRTIAVLCAALVATTGYAADPECSAQCGSEIGFVSSQGPELIVSYDGTELHVPGYCKLAQCGALTAELSSLKAANAALEQRLAALEHAHSTTTTTAPPPPQVQCGAGQKMIADTKNLLFTCVPCDADTYTAAAGHLSTSCTAQTTCAQGTFISADSSTAARKCPVCPTDTYQAGAAHRETSCSAQTTCGKGKGISADSATAARTCSACPANTYQAGTSHRDACTAQTTCGKGKRISADSTTAARTCSACPANTYQDASNHREGTCKPQNVCSARQKISPDSKYARRTCAEQFTRGGHYGACTEWSAPMGRSPRLNYCRGTAVWPMKHANQYNYPKWPRARCHMHECFTKCACTCDKGLSRVALHSSGTMSGLQGWTTHFTCVG